MTNAAFNLRQQLEDLGLSQTGLARTLVEWGDPRSFDVLRRWVQRAAEEDAGPNHHIDMVLRLVRQHIERRQMLRKQVYLFETQKMMINRDLGDGRKDVTKEALDEILRQKAELDKLLKEVRPPVHVFHSKTHHERYGFCETEDGNELPAHHDWQYILGSTLQNLDPPTLGKLGPEIAADIDRWGFAVVTQGQRITNNF